MNFKEEELLAYAYDKFENNKYDEALEIFILLYTKGYERKWILENIYKCYVDCNEGQFRNTFEQNKKDINVEYEDCKLDFIPYKEGQYYIFDKLEKNFIGKFSTDELMNSQSDILLQEMEFSSVVLAGEWDWRSIFSVIVQADRREIYIICKELEKSISFFKIPELNAFSKNIKIFSNIQELQKFFHKNTSVYLPKIWYGNAEDKLKIEHMLEQEHQYRLTSQGRNLNNVLLTIAVPTYHRGHLLKKRIENLQKLPYDAEIEFAVSKNGTGLYQKEYDEVSKIQDSRLNYFDHGTDLNYEVNWHYAVEMAHGKYVLLVSDEDDVVLDAVEHYLALLKEFPKVALIRAKTEFQYCMIDQRIYANQGVEALKASFLRQNYMSGLIFKRSVFLQSNLLDLEKYSYNQFYQNYPHEWWCVEINKRGDYLQEPVALIDEQKSMAKEEWNYKKEVDESTIVPVYATYEARLEQLKGEIEFLQVMLKGDPDMLEIGMASVMGKIDYLFGIARMRNYDVERYEDRLCEYVKICIDGIQSLNLDDERTKKLLLYLKGCYIELLKEHSDLLEEDKNNI